MRIGAIELHSGSKESIRDWRFRPSPDVFRPTLRSALAVDYGNNVTFVMYPKADSSRIVKRQGKEPDMDLWPRLAFS
jgi:hypothetical protein